MEFEIDDEPQGLPDQPDGDRDGGLRERLASRRDADEPAGHVLREAKIEQMGELV